MTDLTALRIACAKALDKQIDEEYSAAQGRVMIFWYSKVLGGKRYAEYAPDTEGHEAQLVELITTFHVDIEWSVGGVVTATIYNVHGDVRGQAAGEYKDLGVVIMRAVAEIGDA